MEPTDKPADEPLEKEKVDQDAADRKRELDIKDREAAIKEREVAAKEAEFKRSRWSNPTVLGVFAAALALIGNLIVAQCNNANSQKVQRAQSEANITLEAIKTGTGNTDAACKNLVFLVSVGLVSDPDGKIQRQCKDAPKGPPSLPASVFLPTAHTSTMSQVPDHDFSDEEISLIKLSAIGVAKQIRLDVETSTKAIESRYNKQDEESVQSYISSGMTPDAARAAVNGSHTPTGLAGRNADKQAASRAAINAQSSGIEALVRLAKAHASDPRKDLVNRMLELEGRCALGSSPDLATSCTKQLDEVSNAAQ